MGWFERPECLKIGGDLTGLEGLAWFERPECLKIGGDLTDLALDNDLAELGGRYDRGTGATVMDWEYLLLTARKSS